MLLNTFRGQAAIVAALAALCGSANAATLSVPMSLVDQMGRQKPIGNVDIEPTAFGLVLTPRLNGLPPGIHGFHVHEKPTCAPSELDGKVVVAGAAGGHLDPSASRLHKGPWGQGHLGDLPALFVDAAGNAVTPVLAPRLRLNDLPGHSLMLHAGGDSHDDKPSPLGGGGARIACGTIEVEAR